MTCHRSFSHINIKHQHHIKHHDKQTQTSLPDLRFFLKIATLIRKVGRHVDPYNDQEGGDDFFWSWCAGCPCWSVVLKGWI